MLALPISMPSKMTEVNAYQTHCREEERPTRIAWTFIEGEFMKDNKGSWHDDPNAVCFVCHENGSRSPGVGFCGKCHGRDAD